MNPILLSFLSFAVPANIAAFTILFWGKERITWRWTEYIFIYYPWLFFLAIAFFLFGSLGDAINESHMTTPVFVLQSFVGGMLAGIALLPRVIFYNAKISSYIILAGSSFTAFVFHLKFILLMYMILPTS
ncbi:MAG: hypothetical protein R8L53_02355 [Mariprofundales bacterium]